MPTLRATPLQNFAGQFRFPAQSRQRGANGSKSPAMERSGMMAGFREPGQNPSQQAVESNAGVLDKLICHSDAGQFCEGSDLERNAMERKISEASKSWVVSRLLRWFSAIGNASRRGFYPGVRPMLLAVSPVCGRRNERERSAQSAKRMRQRMERMQSSRVRHGRRRNRAEAWRKARSASVGLVTPGVRAALANFRNQKRRPRALRAVARASRASDEAATHHHFPRLTARLNHPPT